MNPDESHRRPLPFKRPLAALALSCGQSADTPRSITRNDTLRGTRWLVVQPWLRLEPPTRPTDPNHHPLGSDRRPNPGIVLAVQLNRSHLR